MCRSVIDGAWIISIHTLRMEGDRAALDVSSAWVISIHTLRMEGDPCDFFGQLGNLISIHTLRMEGDNSLLPPTFSTAAFQSTPSAWRVTLP